MGDDNWVDCVYFKKGYCEKKIKEEGTIVPPCDELIGKCAWCDEKLPHSIAFSDRGGY